jgi:protein gp37
MYPYWGEDILNQCGNADVPFFFKQWGRWGVDLMSKPDGFSRPLWPDGSFGSVDWDPAVFHEPGVYIMSPRGKKANGSYLAGNYWTEMPHVWQEEQEALKHGKLW